MTGIISGINKAFDHRVRLGIMSILAVNELATFNRLKELLDVSDGNLASHLKALESEEYVLVTKEFVGKKPQTSYKMSEIGRIAFKQHLLALENLIKGSS